MSDNATSLITRVVGQRSRPTAPPDQEPGRTATRYKAYNAVATDRGPGLTLMVWLTQEDAQGNLVWLLPYADLLSVSGTSGMLTLHYVRRVVTLRGTHLLGRFLDELAEHRVQWVREWRDSHGDVPADEVCIDLITVEEGDFCINPRKGLFQQSAHLVAQGVSS